MNLLIDQQWKQIQEKRDVLRNLEQNMSKMTNDFEVKRREFEMISDKLQAIHLNMYICNLKTQVQQKRCKEISSTITNTNQVNPVAPVRLHEFLVTIMNLQTQLASLPKQYEASHIVNKIVAVKTELTALQAAIKNLQKTLDTAIIAAEAKVKNQRTVQSKYEQSLKLARLRQSQQMQRFQNAADQHEYSEKILSDAKARLGNVEQRCVKLQSRLNK